MTETGPVEAGSFVEGTILDTTQGPRSVETLVSGDVLLTSDGPLPVSGVLANTSSISDILVHAKAFGFHSPVRDLILAAEHLIFLRAPDQMEGSLAPLAALVNGSSIQRNSPPATRRWFTPVFKRQVLINAEGLAVASVRPQGTEACAPAIPPGPGLFALRGRVARGDLVSSLPERKSRFQLPSNPPDLLLFADSTVVFPVPENVFTIPPHITDLHLVSPVGRPAGSVDTRSFGIAITALVLDGIPIRLDGPVPTDGFHPLEGEGANTWRWTDGAARLNLPRCPRPRRLKVDYTDWHQNLQRIE